MVKFRFGFSIGQQKYYIEVYDDDDCKWKTLVAEKDFNEAKNRYEKIVSTYRKGKCDMWGYVISDIQEFEK